MPVKRSTQSKGPERRRQQEINPRLYELFACYVEHARTNGMDDPIVVLYRKLKQQRRQRYENVTSKCKLLQTLSRVFHLAHFVKCWQFFLELNSKRLYRSSGKQKKIGLLHLISVPPPPPGRRLTFSSYP